MICPFPICRHCWHKADIRICGFLRSDDYLEQSLPSVLECEDVGGKNLYKIEYIDGVAAGLELVKEL